MKATLFARVNLAGNPYILLYKKALESQGIIVDLAPEFNLNWLKTKGKSCDVIHLHWIHAAYTVQQNTQRGLAERLIGQHLYKVWRGILRLINFSIALFLAKWQGKIIIYTVHNLNPHGHQSLPFVILNRIAQHLVFSLSDHIHAHNRYTRKILRTFYKRQKRVIVIPHGNYIGSYPNQISQSEARQNLGLPNDAFVYLFIGRIRPYKGIDELVDAFERLESPRARLLIAGQISKDKHKEKLLRLINNHPAIKLFPEFVPDEVLQLYMNACDICVLPYKDITTSGTAMLALSFGRPLIAPAVASFPEIVTSTTGLLYDPTQPNTLFLALQRARQQIWSESKILDYAHQFDWDHLGPQLAALYQIEPGEHQSPMVPKQIKLSD